MYYMTSLLLQQFRAVPVWNVQRFCCEICFGVHFSHVALSFHRAIIPFQPLFHATVYTAQLHLKDSSIACIVLSAHNGPLVLFFDAAL